MVGVRDTVLPVTASLSFSLPLHLPHIVAVATELRGLLPTLTFWSTFSILLLPLGSQLLSYEALFRREGSYYEFLL